MGWSFVPSTKIAITKQKIDFWPQISKFWGQKKHIFAPSGQFEPQRSMFSTQKKCLIRIPIRRYQNFYSMPPKNWIWGQKTAKFGPKLAFLVNLGQAMQAYSVPCWLVGWLVFGSVWFSWLRLAVQFCVGVYCCCCVGVFGCDGCSW